MLATLLSVQSRSRVWARHRGICCTQKASLIYRSAHVLASSPPTTTTVDRHSACPSRSCHWEMQIGTTFAILPVLATQNRFDLMHRIQFYWVILSKWGIFLISRNTRLIIQYITILFMNDQFCHIRSCS